MGTARYTTVIIPARNEEKTIGDIVRTFQSHTQTRGSVFVGIDADTTDNTAEEAKTAGATVVKSLMPKGKGQVVVRTLQVVQRLPRMLSGRIILCDADYTGLNVGHIYSILKPITGMVIGVPDWPEIEVPGHVIHAWPNVSGFRCLPWPMIPPNAHGYLLETQLNLIAVAHRMPIRHCFMEGLKSPFTWPLPEWRRQELERDREWGTKNGIL